MTQKSQLQTGVQSGNFMNSLKSPIAAAAAAFGIGIGTIAISWLVCSQRNKRKFLQHPDAELWQQIGTLKEIDLFPVRSGAAVQLERAECDEFGLSWQGFRDRRLLLVSDADDDDDGNKVCFADAYPLMLGIQSELVAEAVIRVTAPSAPSLTLDLKALIAAGVATEKPMRGYRYRLVECQAVHHVWFSRVILQRDSGMRLYVALDPIVETSWWRGPKYDVAPIMAMHDKSMADLNARLLPENQTHHRQFRGNFLIASDAAQAVEAFDEDNWQWCRIGDVDDSDATILRRIAPCLRCIMVNLDVFTCRRNANAEPLKTLKKYRVRSHPKEPEMGVYFSVYKAGLVKKGDPVYVQYKSS